MHIKKFCIILFCFMNILPVTGLSEGLERFERIRGDLDERMQLSPDYRLSVRSHWFFVDEEDLEFIMTYNGFDERNSERIRFRNIYPKGLEMIQKAEKRIIASFFLFDNMYASNSVRHDIVQDITELLVQKKKDHPDIKIAVILDPVHRSYSRRVSPSVQLFKDHGIDVFYSDLLGTKAATRVGFIEGLGHGINLIDNMTLGLFGGLTNGVGSLVNFPYELDGEKADLAVATGAALIKANHRKILVTDIEGSDSYEALVTSANPHNGSDDSTNTGLSVKGSLAEYIYGVLREDLGESLKRESSVPLDIGSAKYAYLSDQTKREYSLPKYSPEEMSRYMRENWPAVDFEKLEVGREKGIKARFVSEIEVKRSVLRLLNETKASDHIRIQMFYLSDPDIVDAIIEAARQVGRKENSIQLLLDPSKDAFNSIKDGTPNRQVAHYLTQKVKNKTLQIRWYSTHGEQNHAKIMSITNTKTQKFQITTGSTNWTGKNMNDINMEANLVVEGSEKLNTKFNTLFERFWSNEGRLMYSLDYKAYDLETTRRLVLGYEVYQELNNEDRESLSKHVMARFIQQNSNLITNMSAEEQEQWAQRKLKQDRSARIREMSLILGEREVRQSKETQQEWEKDYMDKWRKGEKWGYVAW